jgi:2-dehydropantoate 2-reductase
LDEQKIGIVGMGPVGSILAAYLARGGSKVYGVEKDDIRAEQVRKDGLIIEGYTQMQQAVETCFSSLGELSAVNGLDALFICTKAWAIKPIMADFSTYKWPEKLRVIAFMNGIGPEDEVGKQIDMSKVCRGVVNYAGSVSVEGPVTMGWFHPPNLLGPGTDRETDWVSRMQKVMTSCGLVTKEVTHHEIKKAAYYKSCMNAALSPLCAIHDLTIGRAMRLPHTRNLIKGILRECLTVGAHIGYCWGEDTLDRFLEYLDAGGDHYPSMWHDLQYQRPTEIDFINGQIIRIGRMFNNISFDLNLSITGAIISQEIHNGTRDESDIPEYLV